MDHQSSYRATLSKIPVAPEVVRLVHRSFDEPISDQELLQIQEALTASDDARQWYCEVVQLHADMTAKKQSLGLCREIVAEHHLPENVETQSPPTALNRLASRTADLFHQFPLGIATSLLVVGLGIGCGMGLFAASLANIAPQFVVARWNWKVGHEVVAKIDSTHNLQWQASKSPETPPTRGLRLGQQIRIDKGRIKLDYRSGMSLVIEGPAFYEVRSEHGGKLFSGKMSAVVASDAPSFRIETPVGLLQMGAGRFSVALENTEDPTKRSDLNALIYVHSGITSETASARFTELSGEQTDLRFGDAIRFSYQAAPHVVASTGDDGFPLMMPIEVRAKFAGQTVPLGNLFDDSKSSSLTEAVKSDTFQAAGETIDLGIATVHDGGLDADVPLAEDGVVFNFSNVGGGGPRVIGLPGNDCYRSTKPVAIRTTGQDFAESGPMSKIEDGIGMCANELMTFDLDEIRQAGQLGNVKMKFVADRVGINDLDHGVGDAPYRDIANAHFIAIVSTNEEVLAAHVNGKPYDSEKRGSVFALDFSQKKLPRPLRYNGRYASFDVSIPPNARYLTLATTMLDSEHCDHAVFSGARLEIVSERQSNQDVAN